MNIDNFKTLPNRIFKKLTITSLFNREILTTEIKKNIKKGKIHNFEVRICTFDYRLSSLVTDACGANTFPVRKHFLNPYFQNTQTIVFSIFPTFSSNKRWW